MKRFFIVILCATLSTSSYAQDSTYNKLLDYSRPGEHHAILNQLLGTWNYQDTKRSFVKGTLTRTPMYNGRFFQVQIIGGKLQVPVADGKMKEENYQGMQVEGFDNGRMQFTTTSINNHIGSDIEVQVGSYDSTSNTFTYEWESEQIPGMKKKMRRVLKIVDSNHYTEEYYEYRDSKPVKVRELNYTKAA